MEQTSGKKFRFRAMVSVLLALSFLVLAITGLILFASPRGRTAHWTNWTLLGLDKEQWAAMHMCFSFLFILISILHTIYNWRPLIHYFKSRLTRSFAIRLDWLLAVIFCIAVFLGIFWNVPPFSSIVALNYKFKDHWETPAAQGPIPHAELLPLNELADKADIPLETLLSNLKTAGIEVPSNDVIFGTLAKSNNLSPNQLYSLATGKMERGSGQGRGGHGGGGLGGQTGGGSRGFGRMTLKQVCSDEGINLDQAINTLKKAGIEVPQDATLRQIADEAGKLPHDILEMIRE
ncbi:MAG: DUF4405 domain-containing protein [Sedimentisphaerales bacterium]|nr:DUF4405 domain-containing protein [Sedimentisphaerales bacterium]